MFDFSGVYVHRAQSRHCTQWYLYFVSPSSLLFQKSQSQQYFFYLRWAGEQANCWQTLTWELRGAPISRIGEKSELQASRRAQNWGCATEARPGGETLDELWGDYNWEQVTEQQLLGNTGPSKTLDVFLSFLGQSQVVLFLNWADCEILLGNCIQPLFSSKPNLIISGSPWFPGICWWSWHIDWSNWQPYFCYSLYGCQGLLYQ